MFARQGNSGMCDAAPMMGFPKQQFFFRNVYPVENNNIRNNCGPRPIDTDIDSGKHGRSSSDPYLTDALQGMKPDFPFIETQTAPSSAVTQQNQFFAGKPFEEKAVDRSDLEQELQSLKKMYAAMFMEQQQFREKVYSDISSINEKLDLVMAHVNANVMYNQQEGKALQSSAMMFRWINQPVLSSGNSSPTEHPSFASMSLMPPFHMDRNISTISELLKEWFQPDSDKFGQCVSSMEHQFKTRWRHKAGDKKYFLSRKRIIDYVLKEVRLGKNIDKVVDEIERFRFNSQSGSKISLDKLSKIIKENRGILGKP